MPKGFFRFWSLFHDHTPRSSLFRFLLLLAILFLLVGLVFVSIVLYHLPDLQVPDFHNKKLQTVVESVLDSSNNETEKSDHQLVNKSFYKLPSGVEKAKNESLVGIEVVFARMKENKITKVSIMATGFILDDNGSIITAMHIMGEDVSDWSSPTTTIRVHDGQHFFSVELDKCDWVVDLAMLKIKDWQSNKSKFSKNPVAIATAAEKSKLSEFDHLYVAGIMIAAGKTFDLPLILGPYLKETNIGDKDALDAALSGVINGGIETGFSGGPLMGPDGKVYGVIKQMINSHTFVVTLDDLLTFIQSDQETINKKLVSVQKSK